MDIEENDYPERERLYVDFRRFSIATQVLRHKQVLLRNSKRHNDHVEQLMIEKINHLKLMMSSLGGIRQRLQREEETMNDLRSVVCGTELRSAMVRLKYEHDENLKHSKDATIEKRKALIKRVKETTQRIPEVLEIDAISKNIENSKAQLTAAEAMAEKERVQIKIDKKKYQKDVREMEEMAQETEQDLQQLENEMDFETEMHKLDMMLADLKKSWNVGAKIPSKVQKEEVEENLTIPPIKVPELGFSKQDIDSLTDDELLTKFYGSTLAPIKLTMPTLASKYMQRNRTQASGSHDVSGGLNLMPNVKNIANQTVVGKQSMKKIKPTNATKDAILQAAKRKQFELFHQLEVERVDRDVTLSPMSRLMNEDIDDYWPTVHGRSEATTSDEAQHSSLITDISQFIDMQSNYMHGNGSGNHRFSDASNMMPNVPNIAKQTAIGGQSLETQRSMTTQNDPKMRSETSKPSIVDKNDDEVAYYSSRPKMKSYNKKSHTVTSGMVQQRASATDVSNVPNNCIHGSGSGSHRVSGGSNLCGLESKFGDFDFGFDDSFCFEQADDDSSNVPSHSAFDNDAEFIYTTMDLA